MKFIDNNLQFFYLRDLWSVLFVAWTKSTDVIVAKIHVNNARLCITSYSFLLEDLMGTFLVCTVKSM